MTPMEVAASQADSAVFAAAIGWLFTHTGTMFWGFIFSLFFMAAIWWKPLQKFVFRFLDELLIAAEVLKTDLKRHQNQEPLSPMHMVMLGCITIALAVFSGFCVNAVATVISALATPHG